jgi:predicted phage terminase large subunit-like protein
LMEAIQYADIPKYSALILRDSYSNLTKSDSLIPRSIDWLYKSGAELKDGGRKWIFPSGAVLEFGYLDGPQDHYNFQSSAYQFVGIDESVNIREGQAVYLFSRLRKLKGSAVPLRFRCASNPPQREQIARGRWVKNRYVDLNTRKPDTIFIPSKLQDNPYLDQVSYIQSLDQLDPITRAQLLNGDWDISPEGRMFQEHWFKIIDDLPADIISTIRYWDLAATEPKVGNREPCYTCGVKMSKTKLGQYIIESVIRERKSPAYVEQVVQQAAYQDTKKVTVWMEEEPGSSGKNTISHYRRNILPEFTFYGDKVSGSKFSRAAPFASQAEAGNVLLLKAHWNKAFIDEAVEFPDGAFKDQIDSASGAFGKLAKPYQGGIRVRWV